MKAITIHQHGGPDELIFEEVPDPIPGPGEVLLRVHATSLNHVDIDVRNGVAGIEFLQSLPHIMGVDAAGEVEAVGFGVTRWNIGDRAMPHFMLSCGRCGNCRAAKANICTDSRILGLTAWGGYAEKVLVGENHLVALPDAVSYEDAAAGVTPFATAWEAMIDTAKLQAGETIMVTGAGGGVGSHAVQVAALAGATVIAAVGAEDKAKRVTKMGADHVINYKSEGLDTGINRITNGEGVDAIIDGIRGSILQDCLKCLKDGGRIAVIGAHGGEHVDIDMIELFRKHISILGCGRSTTEIYGKVLSLMATGKLKPIIHERFPLADATKAHRLIESRHFFGRIVLLP
ncbi:alcohol dehydrogenase zinc-binding domain protein [Amniculicola lignicola CBS 123094]|uniref:Alcohol dehydrogenase zinc-binding domain protein n=1 Tax=Amniculicola lignicola CBS 123094 TaxID=1392246 RepID=A0A6A5X1T5_9PLEO|nr:alcohol dehydrogenase zinc-binding domain protein [Amniculicola lignicola CBS 123094]